MRSTTLLVVTVVFLIVATPLTGVAASQGASTEQPAIAPLTPAWGLGANNTSTSPAGQNQSQPVNTASAPNGEWSLAVEDVSESPERIEAVYTQSTNQTLYFKVNYEEITTQENLVFGALIDADQSRATGLNSSTEGWYTVNDIGADYVAVVELEGMDGVWEWDSKNQTWTPTSDNDHASLAYKDIQYERNTLILGVSRNTIGGPTAIDTVFVDTIESTWDYVPDRGEGHTTIRLTQSTDSAVSIPFTETFVNGRSGWTIGKRSDSRAVRGSGEWSEKHGGSVKLHVDGSPSTIQLYKETEGIPAGTTITAHYVPDRFAYAEAGIKLTAVTPTGERVLLDMDNDQDLGNYEQNGTLRATTVRDYPAGTELEIQLTIWPGETTVYVTNITASVQETATASAKFTYTPEIPSVGEEVTFNASVSTADNPITRYAWDFNSDGVTDATGVTPSTTFNTAGAHKVSLTVTTETGVTDRRTKTVEVVKAGHPIVYIEPKNVTVPTNGTTTVSLKMSNVEGGIGAFDPINISLSNPSLASIQTITSNIAVASTTQTDDGHMASITVPFGANTANSGTVELATLTVRGETAGSTALQVNLTGNIARENGSLYHNVSSINGELYIQAGLPALPGMGGPPTNVDNDPMLEDINGNGVFDIGDVQALFAHRQSNAVRNHATKFDFNDNGQIDIGDIQALFVEYRNTP